MTIDHKPERSQRDRELDAIIRPIRGGKWDATFRWGTLEEHLTKMANDYGGLEMIPEFQRGHEWSEHQQSYYIENCIRGVIPRAVNIIQFNCANWNDPEGYKGDLPHGFQCLDGLQRYTAITRFMKDEIKAFGLLASDLKGTAYDCNHMLIQVVAHDYDNKYDLLNHYLAMNTGGTPHSQDEIDRVTALRDACQQSN